MAAFSEPGQRSDGDRQKSLSCEQSD
jgi:hypothetical protein